MVHNSFRAARAISDCSLRSRESRLGSRCLPRSLADEKRVCSFVRPGQRRARSWARLGSAIPDARSWLRLAVAALLLTGIEALEVGAAAR